MQLAWLCVRARAHARTPLNAPRQGSRHARTYTRTHLAAIGTGRHVSGGPPEAAEHVVLRVPPRPE